SPRRATMSTSMCSTSTSCWRPRSESRSAARAARPATAASPENARARPAERAAAPATREGSAPMTMLMEDVDTVVRALRTVLADEQILTGRADRFNRARVPAPFPVHRWAERVPDLVVLPTSTEQVAAVVRIANDLKVPVVPRDGGTGLTDGAVPLRGGILVDVKRMNQVHELDLVNRTVT